MTPDRRDLEILLAIQQEDDEAFEKTHSDYFPRFESQMLNEFPMLGIRELDKGFDWAYWELHKQLNNEAIDLNAGQWGEISLPLLRHFTDCGRQFLLRMIQDGRETNRREDFRIIAAIQEGREEEVLRKLYREYRAEFIPFGRRICGHLSEEDIKDAYQNALIVLVRKIRAKVIRVEGHWIIGIKNKAAVKTVLFGIGRNMIYSECRRPQKIRKLKSWIEEMGFYESWQVDTALLRKALSQLDPKCRDILIFKYWNGLSMREIAELIGSKNATVVRQQKRRCVLKLLGLYQKLDEGF